MICVAPGGRGCRQRITVYQQKSMVTVRDDDKRIVGYLHFKCSYVEDKLSREVMPGGKYVPDSPDSAYEVERVTRDDVDQQKALEKRQAELAEDREKEAVPRRWADWRMDDEEPS